MPAFRTRPSRLNTLLTAALLGLAGLPALAQQPSAPAANTTAAAQASDPRYVWDLSGLFKDDAAWEAERQALLAELPAVRALRAGFGRDARSVRQAMDRLSALNQRARRLGTYAGARVSTDNRDARNQERSAQARSFFGQFGAAQSWLNGEIRALGPQRVEALLKAEPGLAPHAMRLRDVLRQARHQLTPETEAALAALGPVLGAQASTRSMLTTVDLEWPQITVDGQPVRLNDIGYARLRAHPDRAVREQAFQAFFGTYGRFQNTLGSTLAQRVEAGVVNARLRGYPSAVAASLADNDIPESVYRTLVAEVNRGLPTLHRYLALRQRMLKLPDLAYHDIYPDLVPAGRQYSPEDSAQLTLESVAPLGAAYQAQLRQALAANTMHVFPAPGKSSGAYQSGVYGQTPLIFLNHQGSFDSVSTYTHEWGHGMHTLLANGSQPFETAGYSLFVAEVAAFTHELLLQGHARAKAQTPQERLAVLGQALERVRGAYFRQAMFAEFELATHDALERGEALSGKRMTQIYCELLRKYHGADQGVMKIDPVVCSEWAFIPHFYRPFYVYQYATSMAAASHFSQQLLAGQPGVQAAYLNVLKTGGSQYPVPLLKAAGVDMDSPAPYRSLLAQMNAMMDEMEKLLAEAG